MARQLKVKTRGTSSPQGKQKVYFCAHPEDFEKYFAVITDEILQRENVAIWYLEPSVFEADDFDREEHLFDLSQMQLMVMPVTLNLLTKQSAAFDEEFRYAQNRHMPILPIVQESGLEDLFRDKFGDIQFLDKTNLDETAISYADKLTKFLEAVILGDEITQKIRASFDGYIFLSYRKKDRKYANELMKLIHKNELCQDIAIWYDELLTPGENFNGAIDTALNKSDLFALVVTPNLLNKDNYVMRIEYPAALKNGKKVIPVEFQDTDRKELELNYADIPKCVKASEQDVAAVFVEEVKLLGKEDNDKNPEHVFYMGLAYLAGVDVEVDYERAVALITFAAENGYEDAQRKLVDMFRNGEGVECNDDVAFYWQAILMSNTLDRYGRTGKVEDALVCLDEMMLLGNFAREQEEYDMAQEAYEHVESIAEGIFKEIFAEEDRISYSWSTVMSIFHNLIESHEKIGSIQLLQKNPEKAKEFYIKSLYFREKILAMDSFEKPESAYEGLSVNYSQLGRISFMLDQFGEAKAYYTKSMDIAKENLSNDNIRKYLILAVCNLNYGQICRMEKDYEEAQKRAESSVAILLEVLEEYDLDDLWINLAAAYCDLGDLFFTQDKIDLAKDYYRKQVDIYENLARHKMTLKLYKNLARGYLGLANICASEGDRVNGRTYHIKGAECIKIRADEIQTRGAYRELAEAYMRVAVWDWLNIDEEYLEKSYNIYEFIGEVEEFNRILNEIKKRLKGGI